MPWKELNVMSQKKEFVLRAFEKQLNFTELCAEYAISTKTGYKWKERFIKYGLSGLEDRSRKPKTAPNSVSEDFVCEIIHIKLLKPHWGSRKIHRIFCSSHNNEDLVSRSSVDRILTKAGFTTKKKRRKRCHPERLQQRITPKMPNDVWTVDFKGWWYTPKKEKCEPLTVRDEYSKFILSIKILEKGDVFSVKREFEHLFTTYGLPKVIRSDNGIPFASCVSILGLTRLSAWWMSLGILPDRIDPASPYQNGGHERMHRDIKQELQGKINGSLKLHQRVFDEWKNEYNTERPHEALKLKTPEQVYRKSPRKYNGTVYELDYPSGYKARRINDRGWFNYKGHRIFISYALCGYYVGLKLEKSTTFSVWFHSTLIGEIDLKTFLFTSILSKRGREAGKVLPMS